MQTLTTIQTNTRSAGYLYYLFFICFAGGVFGGITSALMSSYLPVVIKDLLGDKPEEEMNHVSAVINAIYLFGMMFGGLLLGLAGDRMGRKRSVVLSIFCIGLGTLLTSFASGWMSVVLFRFVAGFGVGGVLVTTTILIAEDWNDQKRNIALGILSITIPVGIFSAGLITYFLSEWRTAFLTGSVPLVLALVAQFTLRESLKWQPGAQAEKKETQHSIFSKELRLDLILGSIIYGSMLIGLWAVFAWLPSWVQSIVSGSDGQKERGISMILFATGGLSGGFISGWVSNYLGLKRTMILCFAGAFIMSFILFKINTELSVFSYIEMGCIAVFFGISQGALNVYIPELFPAAVRSSATGFCFNIGRIFTASVVFFIGWLVITLGGYGNALFIFSFIFLIGLISTFFAKQKDLIKI